MIRLLLKSRNKKYNQYAFLLRSFFQNKNKISDHKIKIGELNEVITIIILINSNINLFDRFCLIRDKIGQIKDEIELKKSIFQFVKIKIELAYYWVSQWVNNNTSYFQSFEDSVS